MDEVKTMSTERKESVRIGTIGLLACMLEVEPGFVLHCSILAIDCIFIGKMQDLLLERNWPILPATLFPYFQTSRQLFEYLTSDKF